MWGCSGGGVCGARAVGTGLLKWGLPSVGGIMVFLTDGSMLGIRKLCWYAARVELDLGVRPGDRDKVRWGLFGDTVLLERGLPFRGGGGVKWSVMGECG